MVLRVHSFDRYAEVADFDPASGDLTTYERSDAPNPEQPLRGHYAHLSGRLAVVYRSAEGTLELAVGDDTIPLDDATEIHWRRSTDTAHLTIARRGSPWLDTRYELSEGFVLFEREQQYVPTPMAEAEHFDFGLFLAKVASDSDRRDRLYR